MDFIQLVALAIYAIIGISIVVDKRLIISFYLFTLPTNGFFPPDYNLLGILNLRSFVGLMALAILIPYYFKVRNLVIPQSKFQVNAKRFMIILTAYLIFSQFKLAFFNLFDRTMTGAIFDIARTLLIYGPLIIIIQLVHLNEVRKYIFQAINFTVVFLVISAQFSVVLGGLGFEIQDDEFTETSGNVIRLTGLYGGGDQNSLGGFFSVAVGYYLSQIEKGINRKRFIIFILFAIYGILLTLSRMAFISTLIIIGYYLLKNRLHNFSYTSIIIGAVVLLFSLPLVDILFDRLESVYSEVSLSEKYSRTSRWLYFIEYCNSSVLRIIRGGDSVFYMPGMHEYRDPHNFFVRVYYYNGIFFVIAFVANFYKTIRNSLIKKPVFDNFYILIPTLITIMFISQPGHFYYYSIFLASNFYLLNTRYTPVHNGH